MFSRFHACKEREGKEKKRGKKEGRQKETRETKRSRAEGRGGAVNGSFSEPVEAFCEFNLALYYPEQRI